MKWHDKHFHTSPLTIRFLIKAQVLVPHTDWDARCTPPPTEHRSVEELPQWPRERERVCVRSSQRAVPTHVQPSQLLRHNPWMHKEPDERKNKKNSRGCRIYLKRSGEHVSKAGWDLVFLSLSLSVSLLLPFSGNLRGSPGIAERAQREFTRPRLDFHPCRVGNDRIQWERVCARCRASSLRTHTDGGFLTAPESGRWWALACSGLNWSESSGKSWIDVWLHDREAWTHVLRDWPELVGSSGLAALGGKAHLDVRRRFIWHPSGIGWVPVVIKKYSITCWLEKTRATLKQIVVSNKNSSANISFINGLLKAVLLFIHTTERTHVGT